MSLQFEDVFGYKHITTTEIARGGQGAVFRTQNPNIAIKVELNSTGTEFNKDITHNGRLDEIRLLPISKRINLTLPQATLKGYAGYAMTLLDDMDSFETIFDYSFDRKCEFTNLWLDEYRDSSPKFVDVFGQYLESGGRRKRLSAYLNVACVLSELHSNGLVYCDFSSKNVFLSKISGNSAVWIIDADNLNFQEKTKYAGYYTPGYGAPEVIKGKGCTFYSDSYAFAISLFWQLTGTHPFKGQLMDLGMDDDFADDAEERANSGELPWIMDAEDTSNYIDTKIQQEFVIGQKMMKLFDRTFSNIGKTKRQTRPTIFEWTNTLARELDTSIKCKLCGMDYGEEHSNCPWCDTENKKIRMISKSKGREVWRFVHESETMEDVAVPLRLLTGFITSEADSKAFSFKENDNSIVLDDLHDSMEWSVSTDEGMTFIDVYGKTTVPPKCIIKGISKINEEQTIIEVNHI